MAPAEMLATLPARGHSVGKWTAARHTHNTMGKLVVQLALVAIVATCLLAPTLAQPPKGKGPDKDRKVRLQTIFVILAETMLLGCTYTDPNQT